MPENLKAKDFEPHLNSNFRMHLSGGDPFDLELIEVHEGIKSAVQEAFSVVFRGPKEAPRVSQIFTLGHATMGTVQVFLSPFKVDEGGLYYEAVFNRLVKK